MNIYDAAAARRPILRCTSGLGVAALTALAMVGAHAATAQRTASEINVSRTLFATEKAKLARLAYVHGSSFLKPVLFAYADGVEGRRNVYVRASFDAGATWQPPVLLSRDAAPAPTGGRDILTAGALPFVADNGKPTLYAPPVTAGPRVLVAWNSSYCPADPLAGHVGHYANPLQGAGDYDGDGRPDRPFRCLWVATTTDPLLTDWRIEQLTDGRRDVINEVVNGSSAGNAYALAWQEDPAGLQPGEAEGRGDGGSGSHVSGGTNIWYTHATTPDGAMLRTNIVQLSDNDAIGPGKPGASRPNLQVSGNTAALAYEENSCPGGSGGKCVVYHSFPYASHDVHAAGTIMSDVTHNARRARVVLQGASAAGGAALRAVLLWRESAVLGMAQPADIMIRRGRVDTAARPGSTGFLATDLLADTPQKMTDVADHGGNANAHRAIVRGSFVALAYDLTPDMVGADPKKTATPTANYNLFLTRSDAEGGPGSWSAAVNLSRLETPEMTVVEPRTVPTPGTIVNPLTGTPDAGDRQDTQVFYVAYGTERNTLAGGAGRIYLARSPDQGQSFEPFVPVSGTVSGQSESQLRPTPDGRSAIVLWMAEQVPGLAQSTEAMCTQSDTIDMPDMQVAVTGTPFAAGTQRTLSVTLHNAGAGDARGVRLSVALPVGLDAVGVSEPGVCRIVGSRLTCTLQEMHVRQTRIFSLTVSAAAAGEYVVSADVASDEPDGDSSDNLTTLAVSAVAPEAPPPAPPEPPQDPAAATDDDDGGGGCTVALGSSGILDPTLPFLVALGACGLALRGGARACRSPATAVDRTVCDGAANESAVEAEARRGTNDCVHSISRPGRAASSNP